MNHIFIHIFCLTTFISCSFIRTHSNEKELFPEGGQLMPDTEFGDIQYFN